MWSHVSEQFGATELGIDELNNYYSEIGMSVTATGSLPLKMMTTRSSDTYSSIWDLSHVL
jgi:hypothetical protein